MKKKIIFIFFVFLFFPIAITETREKLVPPVGLSREIRKFRNETPIEPDSFTATAISPSITARIVMPEQLNDPLDFPLPLEFQPTGGKISTPGQLFRLGLQTNPGFLATIDDFRAGLNRYSQADFLADLLFAKYSLARDILAPLGKGGMMASGGTYAPAIALFSLRNNIVQHTIELRRIRVRQTALDLILRLGELAADHLLQREKTAILAENRGLIEQMIDSLERLYLTGGPAFKMVNDAHIERDRIILSQLAIARDLETTTANIFHTLGFMRPDSHSLVFSRDSLAPLTTSSPPSFAASRSSDILTLETELKIKRDLLKIFSAETVTHLSPSLEKQNPRNRPFSIGNETSMAGKSMGGEGDNTTSGRFPFLAELGYEINAWEKNLENRGHELTAQAETLTREITVDLRAMEIFHEKILPRGRSTLASARSDYITGKSELRPFAEARQRLLTFRLEEAELFNRVVKSRLKLRALGGDLFSLLAEIPPQR